MKTDGLVILGGDVVGELEPIAGGVLVSERLKLDGQFRAVSPERANELIRENVRNLIQRLAPEVGLEVRPLSPPEDAMRQAGESPAVAGAGAVDPAPVWRPFDLGGGESPIVPGPRPCMDDCAWHAHERRTGS